MLYLVQENELIWNRKFQILYFYSTWIPFHQKMLFMLDKIQQKFPTIAFFAIDADYFEGLVKRFVVESIPTVVTFHDSKKLQRFTGVPTTTDLILIFDDICS